MTHRTSQVVFNLLYLGWYEDIFITMTNVVVGNLDKIRSSVASIFCGNSQLY